MLRFATRTALIAVALFSGIGVALADGGCVDSPESPTIVLGLLGLVAAGLPTLRKRGN